MSKKRNYLVILLLVMIVIFLPINVKASTPIIKVQKKSITLKLGKSTHLKMKVKRDLLNKGDYIRWSTPNRKNIECSWGKWKGDNINLKITAKKAGNAKIYLTNTVTNQKVVIKVKIKHLWSGVKVQYPQTIGGQDARNNRLKITKYNFYDESEYSDYYYMHIDFSCVKAENEYKWFSNKFYCYDKRGNVIDECSMYFSDLKVGRTFSDDYFIPKETAYIKFSEYPE